MSELDAFIQAIPAIAEIIVEVKDFEENQYKDWKQEVLKAVKEQARPFMEKVFVVIDKYFYMQQGRAR